MKWLVILASCILASCGVSPEAEKKTDVEEKFLTFKGESLNWSKNVDILSSVSKNALSNDDEGIINDGYSYTGLTVSYSPDPYCAFWYAVYESCTGDVCSYQFVDQGGICE